MKKYFYRETINGNYLVNMNSEYCLYISSETYKPLRLCKWTEWEWSFSWDSETKEANFILPKKIEDIAKQTIIQRISSAFEEYADDPDNDFEITAKSLRTLNKLQRKIDRNRDLIDKDLYEGDIELKYIIIRNLSRQNKKLIRKINELENK